MYAIQATRITKSEKGVIGIKTLPMFYLNENVQGIISEEHAKQIALDLLHDGNPTIEYDLTALKL